MSHSLLSKIHPAVVFLYFCLTGGIVLFCMDPILLVTAFLGAAITAVAYAVPWDHRFSGFLCAMVVLFTLGNPLFSHNGQTILFLLNDRPVTREAIVYGAVSGAMVAALLSLSRLFTRYMTADRIHALFSRISPRLALFFSMTLRFIPLLTAKARTVRQAQRSIGKTREGGMVESAAAGALSWRWYPMLGGPALSPLTASFPLVYLLLCAGPLILERREVRLWRRSRSVL